MSRKARFSPWPLLLLAAACGTTTPPAKNGNGNGGNDPKNTDGDPRGSDPGGQGTATAPTGPRKPSCSDGSCFECGEGICPSGFYCESNGGAAACGWAAACAQKPTCDCLAPVTKGCSCQDRGGFPFVTCGS